MMRVAQTYEPEVSIVMSVYNGAVRLSSTLESILCQERCQLELIVVNDGSTDGTREILDEWQSRDSRMRVFHQVGNSGLTRGLILGCANACGEFIARQDCGDVSLPGRLAAQVAALRSVPEVMLVASGVRFIGPGDEALFEVVHPGEDLHRGLMKLDLGSITGPPHHGATMFRRADYNAVGGYRAAFVVAQDIDLWLRLAERGMCIGLKSVDYLARMEPNSISARRRDEQFERANLAIECARRRRAGESDQSLIEADLAAPVMIRKRGPATKEERARFYYFVGCCLRKSNPLLARNYFRLAIKENPMFVKAMWRAIAG